MFRFVKDKTTASAAEVTNAAAKSSTNMNVIRFEDTKTGAADAIEATSTTAGNFTGVNIIRFGETKIIANAIESLNVT